MTRGREQTGKGRGRDPGKEDEEGKAGKIQIRLTGPRGRGMLGNAGKEDEGTGEEDTEMRAATDGHSGKGLP